jgi:peroxiredoxin
MRRKKNHKDTKSTKNSLYFFFVSLCLCGFLLSACNSTPEQPKEESKPPTTAQTQGSGTTPTTVLTPDVNKLEKINVGKTIPQFTVDDFSGKPITVASRADTKGELIVVYSPTCNVCHATMPRWIELYRQFFQPLNIPFIALSVENNLETARSIREMNIPFNVVVMPDIDLRFGYRVPDVPMTIAVSPDGTVQKIWSGNLNASQLTEVIKIFCPNCNVNVNKS